MACLMRLLVGQIGPRTLIQINRLAHPSHSMNLLAPSSGIPSRKMPAKPPHRCVAYRSESLNALLKEIRHNPMLWLLAFVPVVLVAAKLTPEAHSALFVLSVLAIAPLAVLLSHATESVAAKTGDAIGGLLNALWEI
jgi:hypothetical protein